MMPYRAKAFSPLFMNLFTGDVYYADEVKTLDDGAVRFTDARSGTEVTVQNSDIKEISEEEFNIRRYEPESTREPSGETK